MSMLQKTVAGQKWLVYAWNITSGAAKTGDAANITAKISQDHGTRTASNDVNPTELEDGYYLFDLTQAETNGDILAIFPQSATGSIQVRGVPETIDTMDLFAVTIAGLSAASIRSAGLIPGIGLSGGKG